MAKKQKAKSPAAKYGTPRKSIVDFDLLDDLESRLKAGDIYDVCYEVRALEERAPRDINVAILAFQCAIEMGDTIEQERLSLKMISLAPTDPRNTLNLAFTYLKNNRAVLGIEKLEEFVKRWPNHQEADKIRRDLVELRDALAKDAPDLGLAPDVQLKFTRTHEECQSLLDRGELPAARRAAEALIKIKPDFAAAHNNIGMSYALECDFPKAVLALRGVIDFEPDNIHALSMLTKLSRVTGDREAMEEYAARLKASKAPAANRALKVMEALTFAGDHEAVLEEFDAVSGLAGRELATITHYAACASANLGDESRAVALWKDAISSDPAFTFATENIADLKRPLGERHGPTVFALQQIGSPKIILDMAAVASTITATSTNPEDRLIRQLLKRNPWLPPAASAIFEFCNSTTISMVMALLEHSEHPGAGDAIRNLALGRRGSDELRTRAVGLLTRMNVTMPSPLPFWSKGVLRTVEFRPYAVSTKAKPSGLPKEVDAMLKRAFDLHYDEEYEKALKILYQLQAVVTHPTIESNIAANLAAIGREPEALAIIKEIYNTYPDYLYARYAYAGHLAREGKVTEAKDVIAKTNRPETLHVTEHLAFCVAQCEVLIAENDLDTLKVYYEMIESVDEEHPMLDRLDEIMGIEDMDDEYLD
ncbi:MAG TPA: hypothetical protein VGK19_20710 [Capsulimonadaceae bacterium]|jgi:tetratricopeptide (TPR) repeat protein